MKIGILGGSFDPVHYGHLYMAEQALQEYALDKVWLVPAGHSPNKDESRMTAAFHRKAMCELAAENKDWLSVCCIEIDSGERSYTYRTMEKLTAQYPTHQFYFIMGADSLDYFEQWRHPEIISALSVILVINRDAFAENNLIDKIHSIQSFFPADIRIVHCKKYDVSSREIRQNLAIGRDVSGMLPGQVLSYIKKHRLYQGKL